MTDIQCLYLENNPVDAANFQRWLPMAWEALRTGTNLTVTVVESEEDAEHVLKSEKHFDLFVADIYMGPTLDSRLGLMAIEFARNKRAKLPIVALSVNDVALQDEARRKGADEYVTKNSVQLGSGIEEFGRRLQAAIAKHRPEPVGFTGDSVSLIDGKDIRLQALIENIGKATLGWFASEFAGTPVSSVQVGYLTSGESGAVVYRVLVTRGVAGQPAVDKSYLIKVSRDRKLLQDELAGREKAKWFPRGLFVEPLADRLLESSGWHAIASEFVEEAKTFREFVRDGAAPATISRCLRYLWLDGGMKDVGSRPLEDTNMTTAGALGLLFNARRRAKILSGFNDLESVVRLSAAKRKKLRSFIADFDLGAIPKVGRESSALKVWAHGDLHGQNVLVDRSSRGWLIDPTNIDPLHWAADYARFAMDLLISGLDSGTRSLKWEDFDSWVAGGEQWLEAGELPAPLAKRNETLAACLRWLGANQAKIHAPSSAHRDWELHIVFAIEALRNSYRPTLSPMKRAMAYSLALHQLIAAEEAART